MPIAVGVLGGFTTFSTLTSEAHLLARTDRAVAAAAYVGLSVGLGLLAAVGGHRMGQALR
jgi:CrcB protein